MIYDPGIILSLPRVRRDICVAPRATLAARWLHEPQLISNQSLGLRFPHPVGRYWPAGSSFRSPGCRCFRDTEGFLLRRWDLILPGCGGTSTLPRGETLAARWLHESQPISNQPVGVGVSNRAGRCRPGGSPFSPPSCRSCTCIKGFMIRGWDAIVPEWRWFYFRAPANQRSAGGVEISTLCGAVSTRRITVFVPGLLEL